MAIQPPPGSKSRASYVKGRDGEPITGLSRNSTDGRYYATHSNPRRWFGKDFDRALVRFHEWKAQQDEAKITVAVPGITFPCGHVDVVEYPIPEDIFWRMVRSRILADPFLAEEKTGLPLSRLHQFREQGPSLTLEELLDLYLSKPKKMTEGTRRDSRHYWKEFRETTGARTARDLNAENMGKYHDKVYAALGDKSPSYVRARFIAVKAIIRHGLKRGKDPTNLENALTLCKMLELPAQNGNCAEDISPDIFHKLLEAANVKWKAMLLLALNAGFYPIDLARIKRDAVDLEKGTLRDTRTKTGVPRIAVLWTRTIEAIKTYLATRTDSLDYLFVSAFKTAYKRNHITRGFARLRKDVLGEDSPVEFNWIRDGAQTAAINGGADPIHADMLLGHRTGIRDDYLKRKPQLVADACAAIEAFYFPPEKEDKPIEKPAQ